MDPVPGVPQTPSPGRSIPLRGWPEGPPAAAVQTGTAQNVVEGSQPVQNMPVIWTQNASAPWSAHCPWLVQPHEPVRVGVPHRVGPPSKGWKQDPSLPHFETLS